MTPSDPILLVDDDPLDVMTLKRALHDLQVGNPLYVSSDGEAALTFLRNLSNAPPALILLDLNMPRMSGLELLKVLKADARWRLIPVVILTSSQEVEDRLASFDLNAAGYIVKPLDYSRFVEILRTIYQYWRTSETHASE